MARKAKITKEAIAAKAFEIVRSQGEASLTAKSLAKALNCSTQPIFWWFENMEEVKSHVVEQANNLFSAYLQRPIEGENPYKAIGLHYIDFAIQEKHLFHLLYMSEKSCGEDILDSDRNKPFILRNLHSIQQIHADDAEWIFREMWLFSHGIATMMATGTANIPACDIGRMLSDVYQGLIQKYSFKKNKEVSNNEV